MVRPVRPVADINSHSTAEAARPVKTDKRDIGTVKLSFQKAAFHQYPLPSHC
jgi:hypothetical protein